VWVEAKRVVVDAQEVVVMSRCVESEVAKRVEELDDEFAVGSCTQAEPVSEDAVVVGHVKEEETAEIEVEAMGVVAWQE
jgi:hypothetical protein